MDDILPFYLRINDTVDAQPVSVALLGQSYHIRCPPSSFLLKREDCSNETVQICNYVIVHVQSRIV